MVGTVNFAPPKTRTATANEIPPSQGRSQRVAGALYTASAATAAGRRVAGDANANVFAFFATFLVVLVVGVECQCNELVVSHANYQTSLDGKYTLYKTCNEQWSWIQQPTQENGGDQTTNFVYAVICACLNGSIWYIGRCEMMNTVMFNINGTKKKASRVDGRFLNDRYTIAKI